MGGVSQTQYAVTMAPEYISETIKDWAKEQQITLQYIQPGKPTQNAYVERFNRTVRHEWVRFKHL